MSNLRRFIESQTKGYRNNTEEEKRIGTVPDATVQYEAVQPVAQKSNLTRYVEQEAAKARASISSGLPSVQTAGEVSPAVSYAEKLAEEKENQPTQKYGLIDGKVVLPSYIENQGLYAAPGTEKSKVNYLMESAAKGLVGGALQAGEAMWQELSGESGKADRAYYDYVMESAYNPQIAGQMAEYQARRELADKNEKLNTDTLGYKLLESSDKDMARATEGMGQTGQFLTGVVGNTLQNAYLIPLALLNPGAASAVMALSAMGRTTKEASDEGKALEQAVVRGAIDGSIEFFTEKIGMDAVANLVVGQGDNIVKEVFRSVLSEAGEEGLSYMAGYVTDKLSKEPDATFSVQELLLNMLAGGLSGGILGGGGAVVGNISSTMGSNIVQLPTPQTGITQIVEGTGKPFDVSALPQATQMVQLPNPINAGIMQTAEAGKPFDISKLPQYRQTIQLPNPANAGVNQQAESGKPFDISTLPQAEKKATPAVSRLKEYINTLSETQGKNAQINLNKKHNDSDMTVAQFVENNADASFYKEGKLYYMEKDGKKLPVKKSMYDYAKYLQSAADTDVGATETVEEKPTVDTTGYGNAKVIGKKGNIDILDSIPEGWKRFDMQTAPAGYEGVTNGESLFGGKRKHALVARDVAIKKPQSVMPVYNPDVQLEQGTLYGGFEADSEEIRLKNKENYVKDTEYLREFIGRDEDADISEINMMDDLHEVVNNSPEYESIKKEFSKEDMELLKETDADLYEELMDVGNYTPESYDAQINYWNKLGENFKSNEYRKYIDEAIENLNENQAVSKKAAERIEKAKSSDQMSPQQKVYLSRWDDSEIKSVVHNDDGSITVEHTFEDFDKVVKVNRDGKYSFVDKRQENEAVVNKRQENEAVVDKQGRAISAASENANKPKYTSRLSEYLNGFSPMQKAKIEKALNVGYKYDGVPMTRAEFVESKVAQDGNADNFVKTERKAEISNAVKKTIDDAFFGGNENGVKAKLGKYWVDTAETKAFMENPRSEARWKAKAVILENARPVKITYGYNKGDGIRTEITKTEYDFAQWLSAGNNSQNIEKTSENGYNVNKEGDNNGKETSSRHDTRGIDRVRSQSGDNAGRTEVQRNGARVSETRNRRKFRNISDEYSARQRYERVVNSPEFYAKDSSGKPIIVFHGTNADFDVFKPSAMDIGIHFGTLEQAKAINSQKKGHRVIAAELTIENPVYVDADMFGTEKERGYFDVLFTTSDLSDSDVEYIKAHSGQYYAVNEMLERETSKSNPDVKRINEILDKLEALEKEKASVSVKEWCNSLNRGLEADLKALGYDGIVYHNNEEGSEIELSYAVFDDSQIKQIDKNYPEGTSKDVSNSLPENKKAEKKARQKKEKAAENKLTDFGEKIGGARKDAWKDRGLDVNDIAGMTDKEKAKFITKDNIWKKPNYEALIKEGKDKNVTYFLKTVRDALPTKPEFRTTNAELARQVQEEYVKQMREFTDLVMSLDTKEKVMNAFDEVLVKGGYITKDSSRLYAPWYPTEKGKHIFTEKLFNAFRNAEGVNGWRYLSNKVQKDQFGVSSSEKIPKGYSLTEFDDGWAVLKGYKVVSKEFATRESALAWLKENTKKTKNNRFVPPSVERVRREGVDVRQGAEVTGEMLQKRYGFHGGEFGNWTNQKERQMNLNFAFDAFHDLARALGISEKDVSLGGKLSIAFGARGKGGAKSFAAHYEPLYEVINLTRMKGAGSLGHEWAHALDDILGTKAIGKAFTKSRGAYQAYDNLLETMKWRNATADELAEMNEKTKTQYVGYAQSWLNGPFPKSTLDKMTEHQKSEFEALKTAFLSGEKGSVDKLNELHKEVTGRVIPKETRDRLHMYESTWLQPEYGHRTEARVKTDFIKGSEWFDEFESRGEDYWRSDVEIFARAFHTYLLDKTEGKSDYLNASAERCALPDLKTGKIYRAYPYGEERTAINKAFDEFFAALKKDGWLTAQEYDAGEMISYSTDGAKVTMEGKIVIEPKKEKAPESSHKLVPEKFAKDKNVSGKREKAQGASGKLPESVGAMKADEKNITHMVNEYGEIKPGENPARFVSVPVSTDGKDRVAKAIRTIMEAGVTKEKMQSRFEKLVADGVFSHDVMHNKETADRAISYIEKYGFAKTYDNWRNKIDNKLLITADDMAQAIMMYTAAADVGEYDITDILAADIAAMTVNSGQVSQVIRILKKTSPQGRLYYTQKSLEAIQDDINDKYGDKAITIEVPQEMKDAIKNAQTSEELQKATEVMHMHIAKQLPFSWSNFINSWRYLAMLGNTRTQVRNVLSNCIGTVAQEYTHFVQAAIEDTALKGKTDRTSTLKAPTQAQVDYAAKDYEVMKDSLAGKGKYKNDSLSALQSMKNPFEIVGTWGKQGDEYIGLKGVVRKGGDKTMKVLSAWNNATNWAMDKGDQIFSERAYKRFFARYLAANNINPDNITNSQLFKARNWATKQALESVYRENNDFANAISKAESKWSKSDKLLTKAGGVALGGLMPFKSTPMNITKRAFEYTPAGIVLETAQQVYANKKSGQAYNIPEIINKAAKSLSGTSLILLGAFLAKAGVLTGGLGDDKEDKMKKQMGQQAYSINIGDWSYTLDWGGAGMMPLFVGADIYQSNSEDDDWLMNIGNALANAGSPIIETSMMTGFMDALQSMAYEDNEIKKVGTALASALSNYIGQFVPTLFGQVARAVDDTSRSSYTNAKGVFKPIAKTAQKMQNKIPFLSKTNVPYMDVWGNNEKNFGGNVVGRLAYNMLSPGYVSTKSNDKVEKMLVDVYEKTGEKSVLPSNYTTYKRMGDETIRFTDKQYEAYTKAYGQTAYGILNDLQSDKGFKSMEDAYRAELISKVYSYSTAIASNDVVDKELTARQANQQKAMEHGLSAYEVFGGLIEADGMGSEGNANGTLSKSEVMAYIESRGGLSRTEKAYLFAALGNSNWINPYI